MDSASEVLKIPAADIEPSPTTLQDGGLNCVTGLGKYQRTPDCAAGHDEAVGKRWLSRKTESEAGKIEARGAVQASRPP